MCSANWLVLYFILSWYALPDNYKNLHCFHLVSCFQEFLKEMLKLVCQIMKTGIKVAFMRLLVKAFHLLKTKTKSNPWHWLNTFFPFSKSNSIPRETSIKYKYFTRTRSTTSKKEDPAHAPQSQIKLNHSVL